MRHPLPRPHLVVFLASFSLLSLELAWTRIFSAEFFYMFAFLILSLAVLGLGLGGLLLRLVPRLQAPERLGLYLVITAGLTLVCPPLILHLGLDFTKALATWAMFGRLVLAVLLLQAAYASGGLALALLFRTHAGDMPRLYRADLLGAALGVTGALLLMNGVGTPATTLLLAQPLAWAAFLVGGRAVKGAAALTAVAGLSLLPFAPRLIAKPRKERAPVILRHWDAMALLKVLQGDGYRAINIDNTANTPINAFDGDVEGLRRRQEPFIVDPSPLMARMDGARTFLSIGAGGGGDVLMALQAGATEIHAVEVNPAINRLLARGGPYAEYSGRIYERPEVRVVTEDARAYTRRFADRFDVIYSLSSNTFAALASGAFALAENYIFTTEAFSDYYRALSPRGYLVMEHQFYMPRILGEALDGLARAGVADPARHIAVYALPGLRRQVILVGKAPLDPDTVRHAFRALEPGNGPAMQRLYPDPEPGASRLMADIVALGWRKAAPGAATDISPCTDDRPFIAQQGLMRNLKPRSLGAIEPMEVRGYPLSKLIILAVIAVALVIVVPLNLLPCRRGTGGGLGAGGWLYFFAIGAGFMVVEVVLIQKYTLFIGPGAYTLAVILFTLLLGSGIGSRHAEAFRDRTPFLAILAWIALDLVLFGRITRAAAVLPMLPRALLTVALVAPLGFFMGMPFPKGALRVRSAIDWGFAVNGAASVLASAGIMLVSFAWGFRAALAAGALAYLVAMLLLTRTRVGTAAPQEP